MAKRTTYRAEPRSIYPGAYEPLPWREKEISDLIHKKEKQIMKPPVNICEMDHHYKVEIAAPGFSTEDFFIYTDGAMVNVAAYTNKKTPAEEEHYRTHDFDIACIEQQISLPENADTNFATAEYRNGILSMHFSKSGAHSPNQPGQIIVY